MSPQDASALTKEVRVKVTGGVNFAAVDVEAQSVPLYRKADATNTTDKPFEDRFFVRVYARVPFSAFSLGNPRSDALEPGGCEVPVVGEGVPYRLPLHDLEALRTRRGTEGAPVVPYPRKRWSRSPTPRAPAHCLRYGRSSSSRFRATRP